MEYARWFNRFVSFQAGIEAGIVHLVADHGMGRCRSKRFSGDRMNVS